MCWKCSLIFLSTLWFSGSLVACLLTDGFSSLEGMNGRLFIRSRCCWARVGNSNSAGDYCSGGDGATGSGKAAEMEVKRRAAVDDKMELRNSNEGGSTAAARARGRKPADARGRRRRETERGPDCAG